MSESDNTNLEIEWKYDEDGNFLNKRSFYLIEFKWSGMFEDYPVLIKLDHCYRQHVMAILQWWKENKRTYFMPVDDMIKFLDSLRAIPIDNKGYTYVVGDQLNRIRQAFRLKCHEGHLPIPISMTVQFVEGYQHFIK